MINFKKLLKNSRKVENLEEKVLKVKILRAAKIFSKLEENMHIEAERIKWAEEKDYAYKKMAVERINNAVIREILRKKAIYMAFKFRALYVIIY